MRTGFYSEMVWVPENLLCKPIPDGLFRLDPEEILRESGRGNRTPISREPSLLGISKKGEGGNGLLWVGYNAVTNVTNCCIMAVIVPCANKSAL